MLLQASKVVFFYSHEVKKIQYTFKVSSIDITLYSMSTKHDTRMKSCCHKLQAARFLSLSWIVILHGLHLKPTWGKHTRVSTSTPFLCLANSKVHAP
jgi:hypothetical protein